MSLLRSVFGAYVRRAIGRNLDGLHVRGLGAVQELVRDRPIVFAATHVAWWDGMLLFPLDDALGRTTRAWMDRENLRRLPFFGPLGALPLDRRTPGTLLASTRVVLHWLDRPGRCLWVFPQGHHRPPWIRPLGLAGGASYLVRKTSAHLVPVGLNYGFREAPCPAAVVSFGPPVSAEGLEDALVAELDTIDRFLTGATSEFTELVPSRVRRTDSGWATRLLSWVIRE